MAFPTIVVNTSGSDTGTSGAGPGTALTGTLASTNSTTVVITDPGVDLSGVDTTGLAVLRVVSSSGRQWARITAIAGSIGNWTVTVAEAYANVEASRTWAIGGVRKTVGGSSQMFLDLRSGWSVDVQTGETKTVTTQVVCNRITGQVTTIFSSSGSRPTITTATDNVYGFDVSGANGLIIRDLILTSTATTPGNGIAPSNGGGTTEIHVFNCKLTGW